MPRSRTERSISRAMTMTRAVDGVLHGAGNAEQRQRGDHAAEQQHAENDPEHRADAAIDRDARR